MDLKCTEESYLLTRNKLLFFFSKGWSVGRLHSDQRQDVSTSELHLYPDRYAHEAALGSNMYTCHVS